jgi:hypothetical protein
MLLDLPNLLLVDLLSLVEPKDRLSFAKSCKPGNDIVKQHFRDDKQSYGKRWAIGQCLRKMYHTVNAGGDVRISWSFNLYYDIWNFDNPAKRSACLCKMGKNKIVSTCSGPKRLTEDQFLEWFGDNMLPDIQNVKFEARCYYRQAHKRKIFDELTLEMKQVLKA